MATKRTMKKGEKLAIDFDFSTKFPAADLPSYATVVVTVSPSAQLVDVPALKASSGMIVQRTFDAALGVVGQEYHVMVAAPSAAGRGGILDVDVLVTEP